MWLVWVGLAALVVVGCSGALASPSPVPSSAQPSPSPHPSGSAETAPVALRYVALGDSYTIGTSVAGAERFPDQLVDRLAESAVALELVANLGVNGFSSGDLIRRELPALDELQPDFVTVLIGVNDVVRGVSAEAYRENLATIFGDLLDRLSADRIVVVSTPDYTRTPAGANFGDPVQQRAAIAEFNAIEYAEVEARRIAWVDISSVADRVGKEPALVAGDGLHPSGKQYTGWVDLIAPVVVELLQGR